jgi:KDO2-lipid IV(A) lauroyltransferase
MNALIYWLARMFVFVIQALPLRSVARLGRLFGSIAYYLGVGFRRVARENLAQSFPEKAVREIREITKENFRRLGENYTSAIKTAVLSPEQIRPHFELVGAEKILPFQSVASPQSRIMAIGHFGNFELYARFGQFVPGFKCAATYRGLDQPALNQILLSLRNLSGCRFFERRTEAAALKAAMTRTGLLLGLLADQHGGNNGLRLSFFGRDCSTSAAPALFALRYHCPLHTAICYRVGLAKWRIEVGEEIPTRVGGEPRSTADIMLDVNREFERAIRRDPANWFWVHRRWKPMNKPTRIRPRPVNEESPNDSTL